MAPLAVLRTAEVRRASLLALFGLIAIALAPRIALLGADYGLDYNEGWNAFQVKTLLAGRPIYTSREALTGSNYPPLSFLLVGLFARAGLPIVETGRIIALIALAGTGGAVFVAVRRFLPASPRAAWLGALIFAGYNATVFRYYVGIYDPQWLAQALAAWSLVLILGKGTDRRLGTGQVLSAAALVALAVLVKHTALAVPIAITIWLAVHDRRGLAVWIAAAVAAAGMVLVADRWWSDGNMVAAIVGENRKYSAVRLLFHGALVLSFAPLIAIAGPLFTRSWPDRRLSLLAIGVPTSLALGLMGSAGEGVDVNAWFDALVMLAIAAPVVLGLSGDRGALRPAMMLATVAILLTWGLWAGANEVAERGWAEDYHRQMVARIARTEGAVACENLIICYSADKEFTMDFFRLRQSIGRGQDPAAIRDAWRRRNIVAVQIEPVRQGGGPKSLEALIAQDFAPVFRLDGRSILKRIPPKTGTE